MVKKYRIGRQMAAVAAFVASNPGCVKRRAANHVNPCPYPDRAEVYGYAPVDRAIRAGLIRCEPNPAHKGTYLLFPL